MNPLPLPDFPAPAPTPTGSDAPDRPGPIVSDFWLLLALFVTFRALTLFLFRPGGFISRLVRF